MKLFDTVQLLLGHSESVNSVAFSPDGRILASGCDDGTVKLWDVSNGAEIRAITDRPDYSGIHLAFSPDGHALVTAARDGKKVKLWDVLNGSEIRILPGEGDWLSVEFSPDGRTVAATCNMYVKLWDVTKEDFEYLCISNL